MSPIRTMLAATIAAVVASGPAMAQDKIRLAQNLSPISGVAIVAKQKKIFDRHGLDVAVSNFTSGRAALEAVLGGGADVATTAEAPITAAAMAKQKIALLARMEYSDLKSLSDASRRIGSLKDLKGRKIGYTAGTGGEVYTMELLRRAALAKSDVTLVNLRPQDMAPALSAGSIDVMNTWEPHITNARKAMGEKAKELDTRGVYAETFNIVTMQDFLAARLPALIAFMRALVEAEAWMKANPDEAIGVVAAAVNMKKEDLAPLWSDFVYEVVIDERTMSVLRAHAQWRLDSGNAPAGATMPDFTRIIFAGPLKAVAPERLKVPGL